MFKRLFRSRRVIYLIWLLKKLTTSETWNINSVLCGLVSTLSAFVRLVWKESDQRYKVLSPSRTIAMQIFAMLVKWNFTMCIFIDEVLCGLDPFAVPCYNRLFDVCPWTASSKGEFFRDRHKSEIMPCPLMRYYSHAVRNHWQDSFSSWESIK